MSLFPIPKGNMATNKNSAWKQNIFWYNKPLRITRLQSGRSRNRIKDDDTTDKTGTIDSPKLPQHLYSALFSPTAEFEVVRSYQHSSCASSYWGQWILKEKFTEAVWQSTGPGRQLFVLGLPGWVFFSRLPWKKWVFTFTRLLHCRRQKSWNFVLWNVLAQTHWF